MLFLSLWILINVFLSLDFFVFYIFFEAIIIPLFFFIGIWGSRSRKIYASYQFFIYTLFGSIFIFLCFLSVFFNTGSSSFDVFSFSCFFEERQFFVWVFLFLGFSFKVPILPFHIWLPEAHVEAPTPGSVILAGILLKLGTYAILRFLVNSFYVISYDLLFFVLVLSLFGLVYSSLVALNQVDIKKIIAYSSIAHMNFSLVGFFSQSLLGVSGAFYMMLGHAITSSALFFGVGVLYDRYKTRLLFYYGGLAGFMPIFSVLYFFFILSNFGFPGTVNFVGEFFIFFGLFESSIAFSFFFTFGLFLSLVYSLFFYNRVFFGPFFNKLCYYSDCKRLEFYVLFVLFFFVIFFGLFPGIILSFLLVPLKKLVFYASFI
jgi:proton-translocating NADH-quinone oxidoreductase chain M